MLLEGCSDFGERIVVQRLAGVDATNLGAKQWV